MDLDFARSVLETEAAAVRAVAERLGEEFSRACLLVLECEGRVVVTGVGKAGLVGMKVAATLSSTGTPSLFLHPTDALHGDLGVSREGDVVLAFSNSGTTPEILRLVPYVRQIGARVVSITSSRSSRLGELSDVVVEMGSIEEAGPVGLVPSASTTAMIALGDALALTVEKERGFEHEDYAKFHPAGEIGRKLLRVKFVMRTGDKCPTSPPDASVRDCLRKLTRARAGCLSVVDEEGHLLGVFTDGDFRRAWEKSPDIGQRPVSDFMTRNPKVIDQEKLVGDATDIMREKRVNALVVVDDRGAVAGLLDVQDVVGLSPVADEA